MKVLILGEAPFIPSSFGKVTHYIASGLIRRGYEVLVAAQYGVATLYSRSLMFSFRESCLDPASVRIKGFTDLCGKFVDDVAVPVVEWPRDIKWFLENVFDADVILAYGTPYASPMAEALKSIYESKTDVPIAGYFVSESLILSKNYGLHAGNATVFASPTSFVRRTFVESLSRWGIPREKVMERSAVVYHGVDWKLYSPETRRYFKEKHYLLSNVVGDGFVIGTFAKNHVRKDLSALLFAYASLPNEVRSKTYLLVSLIKGCGGEDYWRLETLIDAAEMYAHASINDRVIDASDHNAGAFTEWQVLRVYSAMDLLAFPTRGESFGLPPLEAGLMGVPFVVTAHPVMLELWGDAIPKEFFVLGNEFITGEGLVLYVPDIMDLRRALHTAVCNEKLRDKAVEGIKERVKELRLTADGMVDGIVKLIEEARDIGASPISGLGGGNA